MDGGASGYRRRPGTWKARNLLGPVCSDNRLHTGRNPGFAAFTSIFPFQTGAMPELEIQQAPDSIVVIAMLCAMLPQECFDRGSFEETPLKAARLQKQTLDVVELRSGEPAAPWGGEAQFGAVENLIGQQAFHGFFQDAFARHPVDLNAGWNLHC